MYVGGWGGGPVREIVFHVCVCVAIACDALRCSVMRCVRAAAAARSDIKYSRFVIPRMLMEWASHLCLLRVAPAAAGREVVYLSRCGPSVEGLGWAGDPRERSGGGRDPSRPALPLHVSHHASRGCMNTYAYTYTLENEGESPIWKIMVSCLCLRCDCVRCGAMR